MSDVAPATPPEAGESAAVRPTRSRRTLVWVLIVLASVIAVVSVLTTWVNRQMLDEDAWREASAELIEDPQIRDAIAVFLVDELYENVNVGEGLAERLPPELKPLAATAAGALRQPATDAVERLLENPRVQQLFINASSLAQEKLINVLENDTGAGITTGDGVVTVELGTVVAELGADLGLPASALDRIPPDAGTIVVLRSDQLAEAQAALRALQVLSVVLLVLVLAMYALAIFLARGERREAIRNVGFALVLVGLAVLVARKVAGNYAVEALTVPSSQDAGDRVWLISSSILAQIGWAAILYGVLAVLGAILAGPTRAATAVRRFIAPVLNHRAGIAWAVAAAAFLLLIVWGPTYALRTWWGILLIGALFAAGVWALRRQTLEEFPEAARETEPGSGSPADEPAPV